MCTKYVLFFFVFAPAQVLFSQSGPSAPPPARYETFLRNLAVISAKSDSLDAAGVKNQKMKQGVCDSLAINSADCAALFQIALATNAQLQALDHRATAIINGVRAQHPQGAPPDGTVVPPPPLALGQLQAQREALVNAAITALGQKLSAAGKGAVTGRLSKH